jgi:hypothetical protein|nr:MAG TPA: hypothetical protein [Microviridae sp.]
MANLKEAFIIRPTDTDENEFMITIGNHLATEEKFKSRKAAEMRINKTDWNLVAAMVYALKEADEFEKSIKNQEDK